MKGISLSLTCLVAAVVTGCTVHQTEAPPLAGPSELALSVTMTANPDTLASGGQEFASVFVSARDASGAPKANQVFRLQVKSGTAVVDYGSLSEPVVTTRSDGRATTTYTIPPFTVYDAGGPAQTISIEATPVGTDYSASGMAPHSVQVQVVPPPIPPGPGKPVASLAPVTAARVGQLVKFDASGSQAENGHTVVFYYWNFGDGLPNDEHGPDASHVFLVPGPYTVVLGVKDDMDRVGSFFQKIEVSK